MTQYVQLRESDSFEEDSKFYLADPRRILMVEQVANDLFMAWFPRHPEQGPTGEDFENWHNIACLDAEVAVRSLIQHGWIDDPEMDC
jgi:hypothetical protein